MPGENANKEETESKRENNLEKTQGIPSGFRLVNESEVLPEGFTTEIDITTGKKITNAPIAPIAPPKPFPEPQILEAVVNPNEKPKEGPTPFSFTNPKAIQSDMTQPTKGDVAKEENKQDGKDKLAALDAEIARDEKDKKEYSYDDYHDTAEMFVDGWESILIMVCRGWSHDTSDTAYSFPAATREKLIRQGTKVSRKKGWVMPIEFLAAATLLGATGNVITKASAKRKEYMAKQKNNPENKEIIKGGPNIGLEKQRGAGNPRGTKRAKNV